MSIQHNEILLGHPGLVVMMPQPRNHALAKGHHLMKALLEAKLLFTGHFLNIIHIKENSFTPKVGRSRSSPADADYAYYIVLLAITPIQAKCLLYSLEWEAGVIGLQMNVKKRRAFFKRKKKAITTKNGNLCKQGGKFTYLGGNVSSTERDVNMCLVKVWTATYRLSNILKPDQSNKIHSMQWLCVVMLTKERHRKTYIFK